MGDSFLRQLLSEHLLCAPGREDPTAALRRCTILQERLDRSPWIYSRGQNMPGAGPGAEQRESSRWNGTVALRYQLQRQNY